MKCHCRSGKEGEVDHEFVDGSCNARTEYCAGRDGYQTPKKGTQIINRNIIRSVNFDNK